jgi:hypothetical protein
MAKQKIDKNKLINFKRTHPNWTIAATARMFHISKQRAWLILKKAGGAEETNHINKVGGVIGQVDVVLPSPARE